jgi:hypothetical protein
MLSYQLTQLQRSPGGKRMVVPAEACLVGEVQTSGNPVDGG